MIYDLVVVGNGLAAQTFLYELFNFLNADVKNSQNFSVAQVYDSKIFPPASLHTTASVSLNGVKKGISPLGDVLYDSFYSFQAFVKEHSPAGVEEIEQIISASNDLEREKLKRRYSDLTAIKNSFFKNNTEGVSLSSYLISPEEFSLWFEEKLNNEKIDRFCSFFKSISRQSDNSYECDLADKKIRARKVLFCTGAYVKIFSSFYDLPEMQKTKVVSGSFLSKKIDLLHGSLYMTINGHNLIYRSIDKSLVIGSASLDGAYNVADLAELKKIYELFSLHLNLSLGKFEDFKVMTGLRHKGPQRLPIAGSSSLDKNIMIMSGFYKNGFSFAPNLAKKMVKEIFSHRFA